MDLGKKKKLRRIREKKEDRISSLPDESIHIILSRIKIKEAVKTCVLSRRWNRIWTTLPYLNFGSNNFLLNYDVSYVKFVEEFLSKRNHSAEVSTIWINFLGYKPDFIESTVSYVISHNVKEIRTDCTTFRIKFPPWSFPVLTTLHLQSCTDVPLMSWSLPTLTTLHLGYVTLRKDTVLSFEGFVHLKNLSLMGYLTRHDMEALFITSLSLANLTISDYVEPSCLFVISAPNLLCLEYSGNSPLLLSAEDGFPCLEQVNLDIDIFRDRSKKDFEENKQVIFQQLISLFQEIHGAKFLTLSLNTIQVISRDPHFSEYPPSPFGNLKCLMLLDKYQYNRLRRDSPHVPLNHVIIYLLSSSPGAKILIQQRGMNISDYNPNVNMLRCMGSSYSVVDNAEEEIGEYLNEDDEEQATFEDEHISDGGDEDTIVQDATEERVEEDRARQDPELEADVIQQKTITEATKRIPGQVNSMTSSNVSVNGTYSCSTNSNLSLWEGHQVYSEFVDLLRHIKEKYPETFEHFDPQTEMIHTIGLNTLCTSVSSFFEVMKTNVTTSIITHYRGLFSDLERWGFNTSWLVNHLNNADELCTVDNSIDGCSRGSTRTPGFACGK